MSTLIHDLHSEQKANIALALIAKQNNYGKMFNLSGDVARQALRNHQKHVQKGFISKIVSFFS